MPLPNLFRRHWPTQLKGQQKPNLHLYFCKTAKFWHQFTVTMKEERYNFNKLAEEHYYEFFSEGPKGKIKKVIRYSLIQKSPNRIFNLGFGDWNEEKEEVNDKIATNNQDRQKVLATVAATVLDFTNAHSDAFIFAQGSTPARTRLYQMGISAFWGEIGPLFSITAYYNGEWQPFEKGINYEAFLITRKKVNL